MTGHATEPADADIRAALIDIEKYEGQLASQPDPSAATARRTLKLLTIAQNRLQSSANQDHPSWQAASERYDRLIAGLQQALHPDSASAAAASVTGSASARPSAPTRAAPQRGAAAMISQQRARIKKLGRDVVSAVETADQGGVKPFQDPEYVQKLEAAYARYRHQLAAYEPFQGDSDVVAAGAAFERLGKMIQYGKRHAASEAAELGDVQGRLRQIDQSMRERRPPPAPEAPYADQAIDRFLAAVSELRRSAAADVAVLQEIHSRASLPVNPGTVDQGAAYDSQDVQRLYKGIQSDVRNAEEALRCLAPNLDAQVGHVVESLNWVDALDPASHQDQANSFLAAGAREEIHARLEKQTQIANAALRFDQHLGRDSLADRRALARRAAQARADYDAKRDRALEVVRMPRAATDSGELLAIARETLAYPDYEVGEIARLVINSDKAKHERESSEVDIDDVDVSLSGKVTLSGTETTTRYVWEQFQVATAEPVGDRFYIFYNTLKYFTAGATTTPLNRWLLSGRLQGCEIPAGNIDLD